MSYPVVLLSSEEAEEASFLVHYDTQFDDSAEYACVSES